jgi:hypothetical protein
VVEALKHGHESTARDFNRDVPRTGNVVESSPQSCGNRAI